MEKKNVRPSAGRRAEARRPRRVQRRVIIIGLLAGLVTAGVAAAQWRSLRSAAPPRMLAATAQAPNGFAPGNPSKEYVYAGSRLLATEEPRVKSEQTISFAAIPDKTYGDAPFNISATASSGLPVGFAVASGPATVSGNTVTVNGAGVVSVTASAAGSDSYNAAPDVTRSFSVNKAGATLTLANLAQTYDGTTKPVAVTTNPQNLSGVTVTYNGSPSAPTNAGSYGVSVSLSNPNYAAGDAAGTLVVAKATPQVSWSNPANITYGTPLGNAQLNATSSAAGTFVYSPAAGAVLNAGSGQQLSVSFTPTDSTNYQAVSTFAQINVLKATPTLAWANPPDINYGTPLGGAQLNASASFGGNNLAGSFTYSPGAGAVLGAGNNQALSVVFTPADANNFNAASGGAHVNVNAGTPNALSGNGTSDYLEVANSPTVNLTGAFTAEAWVKLNSSTGAYQSIFERYGAPDASGNNGGFYFRVKPDGKLEFVVTHSIQAGAGVSGNTLLTSGVWHHVAGVCDGAQLRIYLDGQLDASANHTYLPASGTTSLFVGSGNWGGGRVGGLMDEARLTASVLYTSDFTPEGSLSAGPQTRGLWKFDNASASDFSGNGNTALLRGAPAFSANTAAVANHSVSFGGGGSRVSVPISQSLNASGPFTVETWFKVNDNQTNQVLVGSQNGAGGFLLMANQGMPQFYVTQSAGVNDFAIAWPPNITAGEWHHMAGVFDGAQLRVYLDGTLCAAKNTTVGPGSVTTPLALGSYNDGSWGSLSGAVDEVRISSGALYAANFTPKHHLMATAATRALWKFDGQTLQDASGNGNTGALAAGAAFSASVP